VSFYEEIRGLEITMGHSSNLPKRLEDAMGREMSAEETRNCFACHTTNGVSGKTLQLDHMMEGITCEACHGPGEKHVAAIKAGESKQKQIFNPKTLGTEEISNFCGTCHRSWEQVALMGLRGINNVRFQPYRLTNSKCYDSEDKRISCAACHNPHEDRKRDATFYDAKCTACHSANANATAAKAGLSSKRVAPVCKVGKQKCSSCHMPKLEIPGSHFKFSDHHIRVMRPGEDYPN
jgi:Cytochrome c554 and c-prime